jgi:hypothetical protein
MIEKQSKVEMAERLKGELSESREQIFFVNWVRKYYPEHVVFAIPNGGGRTKMTAMALKAEGVLAGVPDIFVPSLKLWIEMKKERGGVISKEQSSVMAYLSQCGYKCVVARGCFEAKAAFVNNLY